MVVETPPRLEICTVGGLPAFASVIVQLRMADFARGRNRGSPNQKPIVSTETTVADASQARTLCQFLAASDLSPSSAAGQRTRFPSS